MIIKRFEVYWADLNIGWGCEMRKVRPAVVVSPDEVNKKLGTVVIIPFTTTLRTYPTRIQINLEGKITYAVLDQIQVLDKKRLKKKMSVLNDEIAEILCRKLQGMFTFRENLN